MKLNGWRRIGVVASVIFAIVAGITERKGQHEHANMRSYHALTAYCPSMSEDILTGNSNNDVFWKCIQDSSKDIEAQLALSNSGNVAKILGFSLLPVVVGWLLAYLSVGVFRWVRGGFVAEAPGLSTPVAGVQTRDLQSKAASQVSSVEAPATAAKKPTPFWLALAVFLIAVVFIANRLIAQNADLSPLSSLATNLPVMARHPHAVTEYLAEALGMALPIPLIHSAVALLFKSKRNPASRRRIFIGWSLAGIIGSILF